MCYNYNILFPNFKIHILSNKNFAKLYYKLFSKTLLIYIHIRFYFTDDSNFNFNYFTNSKLPIYKFKRRYETPSGNPPVAKN